MATEITASSFDTHSHTLLKALLKALLKGRPIDPCPGIGSLGARANRPRRHPTHHRIGLNTARDDRAGSDDRALSKRHSRQDQCTAADPDVVADRYGGKHLAE